jgi:aspartate kinase
VDNNKAILTLIADVGRSSEVLATAFAVFNEENVHVEMLSQGASKVNISFIVDDACLERAMACLHACFFEDQCLTSADGDLAKAKKSKKASKETGVTVDLA